MPLGYNLFVSKCRVELERVCLSHAGGPLVRNLFLEPTRSAIESITDIRIRYSLTENTSLLT